MCVCVCVLGFTCVSAERVAEGMDVKHCALSLVCVILYLCVCACLVLRVLALSVWQRAWMSSIAHYHWCVYDYIFVCVCLCVCACLGLRVLALSVWQRAWM